MEKKIYSWVLEDTDRKPPRPGKVQVQPTSSKVRWVPAKASSLQPGKCVTKLLKLLKSRSSFLFASAGPLSPEVSFYVYRNISFLVIDVIVSMA